MSGRSRAASDPYWATAYNRMKPVGRTLTDEVYKFITTSEKCKGLAWLGSGYRSGSIEHISGRALDIMFVADPGKRPDARERMARDAIVTYLQANAKRLRIRHIICSIDGKPRSMIWKTRTGRWEALPNRGSVSANHIDHVHVFCEDEEPLRDYQLTTTVKRVQAGLLKVFPSYAKPIRQHGGVDGILGNATRGVLREFQRRSKIPVTGNLDERTLKELQRYGI